MMPEKVKTAITALRVYAWFIVFAGVCGLVAIIFLLMYGSSAAVDGNTATDWISGFSVLSIFLLPFLIFIILLYTIPAFMAISALKQQKEWGRILGIVIAILMLFSFPLGTIAGGFILYGLLSSEAEAWVKGGTVAAPVLPVTPKQ